MKLASLWVVVLCFVSAVASGPDAAAAGPPASDDFANATEITSVPTTLASETNVGATTEPAEPDVDDNSYYAGASVWYRFTAPQSRDYTVGLCGSPPDWESQLNVYTGDGLASLDWAQLGGSGCPDGGWSGRVSFIARAGTAYYIQVSGYYDIDTVEPSQSPFTLKVTNGPGGLYLVDAQVQDGDAGTKNMIFTATLGVRARQTPTAHFHTEDCAMCSYIADAGSDYTATR